MNDFIIISFGKRGKAKNNEEKWEKEKKSKRKRKVDEKSSKVEMDLMSNLSQNNKCALFCSISGANCGNWSLRSFRETKVLFFKACTTSFENPTVFSAIPDTACIVIRSISNGIESFFELFCVLQKNFSYYYYYLLLYFCIFCILIPDLNFANSQKLPKNPSSSWFDTTKTDKLFFSNAS